MNSMPFRQLKSFLKILGSIWKPSTRPNSGSFPPAGHHFFLQYPEYSCKKMASSGEKSLAASHISGFQIDPIYQHCIKGTFHFPFKKRAEVLQIWKTSAHHLYESPFSGSWIKKVLPFLTLPEATVIVPPCCSIICLDRYRPMPVPLFSRTSGAVPL